MVPLLWSKHSLAVSSLVLLILTMSAVTLAFPGSQGVSFTSSPHPRDFTVTPVPNQLVIQPGAAASTNLILTSINGFTGTISLSATISPSNGTAPTVTVTPASVRLKQGVNSSSILQVSTTTTIATGAYTVTIVAAAQALKITHTALVAVLLAQPPDFQFVLEPSSETVFLGSSRTSFYTIASLNGFAGTVSPVPSNIPVNVGVGTSQVTVVAGGNVTGNVFINVGSNAFPGTYSILFTATSGSLFHQVFGSLTIPASSAADFTLSATPSSLTIPQGSQDRAFLNITSINGFSGTVSLTASVSPLGPFLVLASNQITLAPGGTTTLVLVVFTNTTVSVPFGNYNITVTGSSASNTHTVVIPLTVTVPAENLFLLSASFQPTNLTMQVHNSGNMAASLVNYYVQDKAGNTWSMTSWAGPTI